MNGFDLVIVGAGPGGYAAAIRASQLGLKTALVEKREKLGGTCLNVGCIPTKALLESSEQYYKVLNKLDEHGVIAESVRLDLSRLMERKNNVVNALTQGIAGLMKRNKVDVIQGVARVVSPNEVRVGDESIEAKNVILAMGSVPIELPHLVVDGENIVGSDHALEFGKVPESMVVVGAGAVGLELASVWSRLGAKVTVVEMMGQIVPHADRQVAKMLERSLKKQGLDLKVNSKVAAAEVSQGAPPGSRVKVSVEDKKGRVEEMFCEKLLVAVGRKPCTMDQGLEKLGVELDEKGRVVVDDSLQTSIGEVYGVGDLVKGPMLAHKAEEEGIFAAEHAAGGKPAPLDHDLIPNVVYTWPELAQTGLSEEEAKARSLDFSTGRFYFGANGRALAMGDSDGLVKVIAEKGSDRILGVHILGPMASELIGEATVAIASNTKTMELGRSVHAHPTLSEAIKECALAVHRSAIHG